MKQTELDIFGEGEKLDEGYTQKITAPIYEPNGPMPSILELCDKSKTNRLISDIKTSSATEQEKKFLIEAAHRHTVFNYGKIAEYYANSKKEIQRLMERSGLVIIDFDKAIQYGFVQLSEKFTQTYLKENEQ